MHSLTLFDPLIPKNFIFGCLVWVFLVQEWIDRILIIREGIVVLLVFDGPYWHEGLVSMDIFDGFIVLFSLLLLFLQEEAVILRLPFKFLEEATSFQLGVFRLGGCLEMLIVLLFPSKSICNSVRL